MRGVRSLVAALLCLYAGAVHAQSTPAQDYATLPPAALGPSFACPMPRDPLAQLICSDTDLSRLDLAFAQAYQAYRQQLAPEGQKLLRTQAVSFDEAVRSACGIARAQAKPTAPLPPTAPLTAIPCVRAAYFRQRALWAAHLGGPAAEEAQRPLAQHVVLQRDLQLLGLLPSADAIDGVYGTDTRYAIMAFQQAMGLPVTGLLGTEDAAFLEREVAARTSLAVQPQAALPQMLPPPPPAPLPPPALGPWDTFKGEATALGVKPARAIGADGCTVVLEIHTPDALLKAVRDYDAQNGGIKDDDEPHLFKAMLSYLTTQLSTKAVHALFADQPSIQRCTFAANAYTADVYGRDVPHRLFSFSFDRPTFSKVVWDRFDPGNLPKIVSVEYGQFAQEQLRLLAAPPAAPPTPAVTIPAVAAPDPAPRPDPPAPQPLQAEQASLSGTHVIGVEDFLLDRGRYEKATDDGEPVRLVIRGVISDCSEGKTCSLSGKDQHIVVDITGLDREDRKHLLEHCSGPGESCPVVTAGQVSTDVVALKLTGVLWQ